MQCVDTPAPVSWTVNSLGPREKRRSARMYLPRITEQRTRGRLVMLQTSSLVGLDG